MTFDHVPLKRVARIIAGQSPPSAQVGHLDAGTPFLQGNAEFGRHHPWPKYQCDSAPKHARAHDVLVSVRAPVGALNVADRMYAIGRGLCAVRSASSSLDDRYLWWAMQSMAHRLASVATGSTYEAVTADDLGALDIPWPSLIAQEVIADFLEVETARIDALVAKKRDLVDRLVERREGLIEHEIRSLVAEAGDVPLKRVVSDVTVGIVVTPAKWYAQDGVPTLRGVNVRAGRIDMSDVVYLTEEGHFLHSKSKLRSGDVVVVRTGQAGAAAVIPPGLDGVNCIDLLIVRPGLVDSQFLALVLNSDWTQKHIANFSVGSIQSHFNVGSLRELPVPKSSRDTQRQVAAGLLNATSRLDKAIEVLHCQTALLEARRRILITAAVTGQMEISGVEAA